MVPAFPSNRRKAQQNQEFVPDHNNISLVAAVDSVKIHTQNSQLQVHVRGCVLGGIVSRTLRDSALDSQVDS